MCTLVNDCIVNKSPAELTTAMLDCLCRGKLLLICGTAGVSEGAQVNDVLKAMRPGHFHDVQGNLMALTTYPTM